MLDEYTPGVPDRGAPLPPSSSDPVIAQAIDEWTKTVGPFPAPQCHPAADNRNPATRKGIDQLGASIARHGQLVPGIVCPHPDLPPPNMLILDGVGRWWICLQKGIPFIALSLPYAISEEQRRELRIQTNEIREGMSPVELAMEYNYFLEKWRCSQKALAERLNISQQKVCRALKTDLVDESLKPLIADFTILPSFVPFLADIPSPDSQKEAVRRLLDESLTRDQFAEVCAKFQGKKTPGPKPGVQIKIGSAGQLQGMTISPDTDPRVWVKELKSLAALVEANAAYGLDAVVAILRGRKPPTPPAAAVPA